MCPMRIFAKLVCLLFFVSLGIGLGLALGVTLDGGPQIKQQMT